MAKLGIFFQSKNNYWLFLLGEIANFFSICVNMCGHLQPVTNSFIKSLHCPRIVKKFNNSRAIGSKSSSQW
jgi:hypothetical protein